MIYANHGPKEQLKVEKWQVFFKSGEISHFAKAIQNGCFWAKIKIAKNTRKTTLQPY